MLEHGIPLEAIVTELVLSGEVERTYRLVREVGYAVQMEYHSPTSQYGQLTRRGRFDHLDVASDDARHRRRHRRRDASPTSGTPSATPATHAPELKAAACSPEIIAFERDLRARLGELARPANSSDL